MKTTQRTHTHQIDHMLMGTQAAGYGWLLGIIWSAILRELFDNILSSGRCPPVFTLEKLSCMCARMFVAVLRAVTKGWR